MVAKKKTRIVFRVGPVRARLTHPYMKSEWGITKGKRLVDQKSIKSDAIREARKLARRVHANGGLSQLVIHKLNGQIQTEYTYGEDPRRSKG